MAKNNAGGWTFTIDDWKRLDRFLILGSEGGTYYVKEKALTVKNARAVHRCIDENGVAVVRRIVDVSAAGRAPKNDPALFALAMCAGLGDTVTRKAALLALPEVARIGTHLFHFADYVQGFRGWGRALRQAFARWYNDKDASRVAHQAVKYQQRDGWSHRDLLRLSHPIPVTGSHTDIYHWITKGWKDVGDEPHPDESLRLIWAYEKAKRTKRPKEIVRLITDYNLTREMIPSEFLNDVNVWAALLERMPMTAMIRNLGKMTDVGLIRPMAKATATIRARLRDEERLRKARVHPLAVLVALKTYEQKHGMRGKLTWDPNASIVDALDDAFYLAFGNVEPAGKRTMLALDVSGSMTWHNIAGMPITPQVASAAMVMVTARAESEYVITAFSDTMIPVSLSPRQRLDDICRQIDSLPAAGTDCALPMIHALEKRLPIDTFIVYTDSETWYGNIHPCQALVEYRQKMGIDARLIVVGMTPSGFTVVVGMKSSGFNIADPNDSGMLDVVGFDTATPAMISNFSRGAF